MLVLSRYCGQWIVIRTPEGRTIRVMPSRITGFDKVRIGVEADPDVKILREEIDDDWRRDSGEGPR